MAVIDITLGTFGRHEQFCETIRKLNEQTIADKFALYIMDGNGPGDNKAKEFLDSIDWKFEFIKIYKDERCVKPKHKGKWPVIYNYLMRKGSSKFVTFWSDDVFPNTDCFERGLEGFGDHKKSGAVAFAWQDGPKGVYSIYGTEMHGQPMINFGLIRRRVLERIGFLDTTYSFYNADQDLSLKIWYCGFKIIRVKKARVTHYSGKKAKNPYRSGKSYDVDCKRLTSKWAYDKVKARRVAI